MAIASANGASVGQAFSLSGFVPVGATETNRLKACPTLRLDQFLLQALGLKMRDERVDKRAELSVHHFGKLVQR
jgi:hypothetical protein